MIMNILNLLRDVDLKKDENGRVILTPELVQVIITAIQEKRIPLVMDESDLMITIGEGMPNSSTYDKKPFSSIDDVVAVHISPIPPVSDEIITPESSGVTRDIVFIDPSTGREHIIPYLVGNDTIHFTLNCAVHNHESGNDWDSYQYGVMIPLKKLDKSKVLDVKSEDTYVDGNAELTPGYFLFCPLGEREKVEKENPGAIVIEYHGITLRDAISCMILYSGYILEPYGTYGWGRSEEFGIEVPDVFDLEKLAISEGYPVLKGAFGNALHSETQYMARRMWKREYEALISLIQYIQEHNIDMPVDVMVPILMHCGAYGLPGTVPVSKDDFKEVVFPILKKYGYDIDDSLFDGVDFDQSIKIINYPPDGEPFFGIPQWENELRDRIITLLMSCKGKQDESLGDTPKKRN